LYPPRFARSPRRAREDELGQLGRHLDAALAGATSVAFVSGDAGSGKTTLVEAFAEWAMARHPDLLVAGARCSPGGSLDAFASLRRLAEVLFGDLDNDTAWRLAGRDQVDRLQHATGLALSALADHGPDLAGALVAPSSVARRGVRFVTKVTHASTSVSARTSLSQGVLFDQLASTLAAIVRG
jgi:predicted ATPase